MYSSAPKRASGIRSEAERDQRYFCLLSVPDPNGEMVNIAYYELANLRSHAQGFAARSFALARNKTSEDIPANRMNACLQEAFYQLLERARVRGSV